ncbi:MAG: PAS domain S-box protein [Planctomycetes bacterium]|nr:PAS domain S-box protein [Planctomycetota bacterium]
MGIFTFELFIMLLLPTLRLDGIWEAVVDSAILALLLLPLAHLLLKVSSSSAAADRATIAAHRTSRGEAQMWAVLGAFLIVIGTASVSYSLTAGSRHQAAHVVNVAGSQRMLAQRVATEVLLAVLNSKESGSSGEAGVRETFSEFENILAGLRQGDHELGLPPCISPDAEEKLGAVSLAWHELSVLTDELLGDGSGDAGEHMSPAAIAERAGVVVEEMDNAVLLLQQAYNERQSKADTLLGMAMLAALSTALLLACLLRRVMYNRVRLESDLRGEAESREALLEAMPDAIVSMGSDGRIVTFNRSAESMFGIPRERAIGAEVSQLLVPEAFRQQHDERLAQFLSTGESSALGRMREVTAMRSDGGEFPADLALSLLGDAGDRSFLACIRDISARKALEAQVTHAQKMESIGQLAAGVAHEINTPTQYVGDNTRFLEESFQELAPLLQLAEELAESVSQGTESSQLAVGLKAAIERADFEYLLDEIPRAIEQSLSGIDRVRKIVQSMKEFSHPGEEGMSFIDLHRAIQSTITVATNEWKYVAEVETDFDSELPLVPCLPGELNQVVLNIIVNAAHAIADVVGSDGDQKGTIRVTTMKDGDFVEIRISDTGSGIPEAARSKVFDPFFTTKEVGKGTGQGLAIAHRVVVNQHGGTLAFETELGKGTTFVIRLPLDVPSMAALTA